MNSRTPMGHNARMSLRRSVAARNDKFGAGSTDKKHAIVPITLRRKDYEANKAAETARPPKPAGIDMRFEPQHRGPRK